MIAIENAAKIVLAFLALFLISCSKKQKETAQLNFQFQSKSNTALNSKIDTLIINIHHPEGQVQYKQCENSCSKIQIETTTGPGKLIQVLAVVDGAISADVHYGDVLIDLQVGNNEVPVALASMGSFSSEGRVQGRYIPRSGKLAGKYLTGELEMRVFVGEGKPAIKIQKNEIFGGLVNLFALDTIPFLYYFSGVDQKGVAYKNEPIFTDLHDGSGLTLDSPGLAPKGREIVHFTSVGNYFEQDRDDTFVSRPKFHSILGSFGLNPSGKQLCTTMFSSNEILDGSDGKGRLCGAVSSNECSRWLTWGEILASSTHLSGETDSCSPDSSFQPVNLTYVTENHLTNSLGFFGPFSSAPEQGLVSVFNFNQGELTWKIDDHVRLPQGVDLFVLPNGEDFNDDAIRAPNSDGILCEKLTSNGFQFVRNLPANPGQISRSSISLQADTGYPVVALCLKKSATEYYKTALMPYERGEYQGGEPTRLRISKVGAFDGGTGQTYADVCTPLLVEALDEEGALAHLHQDLNLQIDSTGDMNEVFFLNQADCEAEDNAHSAGSSWTVSKAKKLIWLRSTSSADYSLTVHEPEGAGEIASGSVTFSNLLADLPLSSIKLSADFNRNPALEIAVTEECVPFLISAHGSNGELTNFDVSTTANLHAVQDSNSNLVPFYASSGDCQNEFPTIGNVFPLPDGERMVRVYLRGTDLTAGQHIPQALTSSNVAVSGSSYIGVVNPGPFHHYHAQAHGSSEAGSCRRIQVGAYDNHKPNSYPVYFPASESISVSDSSSGVGHFFMSNLDIDHSSGYPCDYDYANSEALSLEALETDLNSNIIGETAAIFYYQPITYGTSNELTLNFEHGDSQYLSVQNTQPTSPFLQIIEGPSFEFDDQSGMIEPVHMFTVVNLGQGTTTVTSAQAFPPSQFTASNFCTGLGPGDDCNISVTMEDDGFDNVTYDGYLRVTYSVGGEDRVSHVNLKGRRLP